MASAAYIDRLSRKAIFAFASETMAGAPGLEPAASFVTANLETQAYGKEQNLTQDQVKQLLDQNWTIDCYTVRDAIATVCSSRGGHFLRPDSSPPFLPAVLFA